MSYADRIRALAHVQSLELEPDGWCCNLHPGLTTAALSGSGTIIDPCIRTVWAFVKGQPMPAQSD
jgi:hypothetical protein